MRSSLQRDGFLTRVSLLGAQVVDSLATTCILVSSVKMEFGEPEFADCSYRRATVDVL